jgi:zinc D-Ala-D-Ala carboxypeptidase
MTDYELTPNFSRAEFLCKHCGKSGINLDFVGHLQALRDAIGVPLKITSGYRCPQHWDEVKKAKPGRHTEGIAADLYAIGKSLSAVYRLVLKDFPEFTGIGVAPHQNYIHLDTRPIPKGQRAVVWSYDRSGAETRWDGRWENLPK